MFRRELRLFLIHHHSTYRVYLHQLTSLSIGIESESHLIKGKGKVRHIEPFPSFTVY